MRESENASRGKLCVCRFPGRLKEYSNQSTPLLAMIYPEAEKSGRGKNVASATPHSSGLDVAQLSAS